MKKTFTLSVLLITLTLFLNSQNNNWSWARPGSGLGPGSESARDVCADLQGNVLITGVFTGPGIVFSSVGNTVTLSNSDTSGTDEMFVAKYDVTGNLLWATSAKGIDDHDRGNSISTDASGNVYVTGYFQSSVMVFESYTLTNSSAGSQEIFVVKYDPSGNVIWAKSYGGSSGEQALGIAVDASGNSYIAGGFNSGSVMFGVFGVVNSGHSDAFVTKLDVNGNVKWTRQIGGNLSDLATAVEVDLSGNIYVTGAFESATLGFFPILVNAGGADVFYVKYDPNGNVIFSGGFGGTLNEDAWDITADVSGNFFIVGRFESSPLSIGGTVLNKIGTMDYYTAGFSFAGNPIWAIRNKGNVFGSPTSVCADLFGNVYVTGNVVNVFPFTIGTTTLTAPPGSPGGGTGAYLCKLNSLTGAATWGTSLWASCRGMDLDLFGNLYVAGSYSSLKLGNDSLPLAVQSDVFVAKMCNLPVLKNLDVTVCAGLTGTIGVTVPPGFVPSWFDAAAGGSLIVSGSSTISSAASGTFYIELKDTLAGCKFTGPRVAMSVSVHPQASVSISGNTLTTNFNGNISFKWYDCIYGGIVSAANDPFLVPDEHSSYAVIVKIGECVDTSDCFTFPPLGVDKIGAERNFLRCVPNPGNGHFTVTTGEAGEYRLLSADGRQIRHFRLTRGENDLDISELGGGIYLLYGAGQVNRIIISK